MHAEMTARVVQISLHPYPLHLLKDLLWVKPFPKHQLKQNPLAAVILSAPHTPESSLHSRSPFPASRTGTAGVVLVSLQWNLITILVAFLCLFDMVV